MSGEDIFVYFQKDFDITFELLGAARSLALEGQKVCALCFGADAKDISKDCVKKLFEGGADKIYHVTHEKLANYNSDYFSAAAFEIIKAKNPTIVLIGATHQGRDFAPRVSTKLNTGLVADCTKLEMMEFKDKMRLAATRPTFGGQLMATILCKNDPQMATVREHVLRKLPEPYHGAQETEEFRVNLDNVTSGARVLEFIKDIQKNKEGFDEASIILSGGMGLKKEGFSHLDTVAKILNDKCYKTAVGATRGAVDAGMAPHSRQIGQTGRTVTPKIYVAFGISGAIQHLMGMQNSDYVIAINTDPDAPIFENCDLGIVADAHAVLEQMIAALKP